MAYHLTQHVAFPDVTDTSTTQKLPLGTTCEGWDPVYGKATFIYLKGVAATAVGSLVTFDIKNGTTTLTVAASKGPCAVAMSANVASQYGWYCLRGVVPVTCAAAAVAGALLYVTATAGAVDDAAVAGQGIDGLVLLTAAGGAGNADAYVNEPTIGTF